MPDPIFTYELFHDFIQASELPQQEERIKSYLKFISNLNKPRVDLYNLVMSFLVKIHLASKTQDSFPSASELSSIFSDAFLRARKNSIHLQHNKIPAEILKELIIHSCNDN